LPKKSNIAIVSIKDAIQASTSFSTEVPVETSQPGIFMTGAGPVNIFGTPIKSSALPKPAPVAISATAPVAAATTAPTATITATTTPAPSRTTSAPETIKKTSVSSVTQDKETSTGRPATAPLNDKVSFINDGSIEYAIELANRFPLSDIPKLDMTWPTIKAPQLDPQVSILVGKLHNDDWYSQVPEWARAEVKPDMYKDLFTSVTADINSRHRSKYSN